MLFCRCRYQRKYAYQEVSRTLCQPQSKAEVETQHFYVDVSTLSLNASYQLRVTRVENFYFKYEFPKGVDSVIVKVTSAMAFPCSVISIQDILCPVYDLDNNVAFIGMYQTMTKKAAITVQKKDFPSNSFYVVVVVKTEDEACGGALPYYPLSKHTSPDEPVDQHNRQKMLEEDDYDTLADIDYDKNVIRTKQYLCVADLARKDKRVLRKKYQIYFWNIATIAVFYALPVIQLVITYQTVVNVTGNQDICYYNFLRAGSFPDTFSHGTATGCPKPGMWAPLGPAGG
ncbi:SID1 transmembrane family member 2 [Anas platyrhynchos]|uniref:SID1 transmembrane family member 2 n=1 Tax=Anas platyrhynchos TaxID=8839 RepID=R0LSH4_ANAPL|nr:SID1 transmembrane family member 2 [Anas platyrhynchos]